MNGIEKYKEKNLSTYSYDFLQEEVINYLNDDVELYSTCHWAIDDYYQVTLGNCTDITGYPYSGKTLFLIEVLFNLSKSRGFKHLLHLPDSGKPAEVIANLIHKYTGKSFDKRHKNAIKEHEIIKCFSWINEHFQILKYDKRPTPVEFWEYASKLDVQTASIDSWNYMKHDKKGLTISDYLADVLSYRNELAEKCNKHFFTIIHPKNPTKENFVNGILKAPDGYCLMGGSEWNNNGKNIISVHKETKESLNFDIYIQKTKPRIVGKTGIVTLQFDIKNQLFYSMTNSNGGTKEYAVHDTLKLINQQEIEDSEVDDFF